MNIQKIAPVLGLVTLLMAGCDKSVTQKNLSENSTLSDTNNPTYTSKSTNDENNTPSVHPIITPEGKTQIDWTQIDTKEPRADLKNYAYPIAIDTQAVKNYAKAYHISDTQAQHSIVVGMASPEVLGKLFDQLIGKYITHYLTDGANITLIIETTADVVPQRHEYVFADTFGRGLVLPVIIKPTNKTTPVITHYDTKATKTDNENSTAQK